MLTHDISAPRVLEIRGLSVCATRQGRHLDLVRNLSLTLNTGEILALVGASGSGKSMTCAGAQGVLPPGVVSLHGRVVVDGVDIPPAALRGRLVSTVLQNPRSAFNPVRTMFDHACEVRRVAAASPAGDKAAVQEAFVEVGLDEADTVMDLYPFEMSGGMLQRVMIALAILSGAPFIFADEPTTDLDLIVQARILDLLAGLVARRGLGMLLITHDMGVVARLATRVAVMEAGQIVEEAPVSQIFQSPRHPATRALVAAHLKLYDGAIA